MAHTISQLSKFKIQAEQELKNGGCIHIRHSAICPFICVRLSTGYEFWFDAKEAERLLANVPDGISPEDWILFQALNGQLKEETL